MKVVEGPAAKPAARVPTGDDALRPIRFQAHRDDISATVADWQREAKPFWAWNPSRSLIASLRAYQRHGGLSGPWHALAARVAVVRHRFWSAVTGADIPLTCRIGGGLMLPHPNGVVVHPQVRIGPNCLIFQQVTLGATLAGVPVIGGRVDIGAGAKVLGPVAVGNGAQIGANAVVLADVPEGAVAVGIPARIVGSAGPATTQ
jgi:serine O-acetyltransferase